jgi:hypothetical protein
MPSKWRGVDDLPDLAALGFEPVPLGSDPPDAYLAPHRTYRDAAGKAHDELCLDDLPRGVWHGRMAPDELPTGPGTALAHAAGGWTVRMISGIGWALREGKGPPRDNGTRPKLRILEPCTTITLRAVGFDDEWDDVTHHVVISWCRIARTGKSGPDVAFAWSSEPNLNAGAPRVFRRNPRPVSLSLAGQLLAGPCSDTALSTLLAEGDREREAYAMLRAVGERA